MSRLYHPLLEPLEVHFKRPLLIFHFDGDTRCFLEVDANIITSLAVWAQIKQSVGVARFWETARQWQGTYSEPYWPTFVSTEKLFCWAFGLFLNLPLQERVAAVILRANPPTRMSWKQRVLMWQDVSSNTSRS